MHAGSDLLTLGIVACDRSAHPAAPIQPFSNEIGGALGQADEQQHRNTDAQGPRIKPDDSREESGKEIDHESALDEDDSGANGCRDGRASSSDVEERDAPPAQYPVRRSAVARWRAEGRAGRQPERMRSPEVPRHVTQPSVLR